MADVVNVGIAGFGRSGRDIHANYLKTDSRFRIVAVADALADRREDAVKELGCAVYSDYQEMLDAGGFDLFINATPSRFHVSATLAGFKAGYHVLSEKPSATTLAEFDEIMAASEQAGKLFFPFQNSRFKPDFRKALKVVRSGVLGEIISVRLNWSGFGRRWDWQTLQSECAGNLYNTGPHPVDQAICYFGDSMPKVFCNMKAYHWDFGGDADNFCALTLYGDNAPTVEVQTSSFLAYPQGDILNIQGTLGGLTGTLTELKWKYFDPETAPKHEFWRPWSRNRQYCSEKLEWQEETWRIPEMQDLFHYMNSGYYNCLINVLQHGAEREIRLDQVRRQIYVLEEAHKQNPLPRRSK